MGFQPPVQGASLSLANIWSAAQNFSAGATVGGLLTAATQHLVNEASVLVAPEQHFYGKRGAWVTGIDVANNGGAKDFVSVGKITPGDPSAAVTDLIYISSNDLRTTTTSTTTLPQGTINVADTSTFPSSGSFWIGSRATGWKSVTYTGKTGTTFTGCTGGSGEVFASGSDITLVKTPTVGIGVTPPNSSSRVQIAGAASDLTMNGVNVIFQGNAASAGRPFIVTSQADGRIRQAFGAGGGVSVGGDPDLQATGGVNFLNALNVEGGASGSINCSISRISNRILTTDAIWNLPSALSTDTFALGLKVGGTVQALAAYLQQGFDADGSVWLGHNAYYASGTRKWETTSAADGSRGMQFSRVSGMSFHASAVATTAGSTPTGNRRMQISNAGDVIIDPDGLGGVLRFGAAAAGAKISLEAATTAAGGILAGGDTNLYRSAADTWKTDDAFEVGARFRHLGTFLGFYGVASVTRQTVLAAATDAATTQALVNDLRSKLVTLGLVQ